MLESVSERLCERGGPHHGCPDKRPQLRLETIRAAGEVRVPFTSGILIGIGETRRERIEALLALRALHARYDHLQEIIVQNFRAKPGTAMADAPEPALEEHLWTIALARIVFAPEMSIQAPPNLNPAALDRLLAAGIDDWGGISPVTPDHVNPEAPWPQLETLRRATEAAGKELVARLPIYPRFVQQPERWLAPEMRARGPRPRRRRGLCARGRLDRRRHRAAAHGGTRRSTAAPPRGDLRTYPASRPGRPRSSRRPTSCVCSRRAGAQRKPCVGTPTELRQEVNGDRVAYVVNRNINYTNVCYFHCRFCAFSKGKLADHLRGLPYEVDLAEIARRTREAWQRGATEMCLQGGIHPDYTGQTYLDICRTVKEAAPGIHVHAFSPLEVWQGARTLGVTLTEFLAELQRAGLGSLPGTAAEILDDEVRRVICPDKITTAQWLEVMACAHSLGLRSTATVMFGHVDHPRHWARHLLRIRDLQAATGGFTELVPLPFVHMETPIYLKGGARKGPTWREALLMHAVARLVLHPQITNIQTSWVKMGPRGAQACLACGRERPRRHADEQVDHARRRGGVRPGAAAAGHAGADRRAGTRALSAHDRLRRGAGRARQRLVPRGAAGTRRQPSAAPPRALARASLGALRIVPLSANHPALTLAALPGIPAIRPGDDLARILGDALEAAALRPRRGDVLVVTHKIVSKAEGRYVALAEITPSPRARELATATGKDAALVEVILSESRDVLRFRPGLIITEHRLGMVLANAGVDQSNVPRDGEAPRVLLLPQDPDASSAALRAALQARFGEPVGSRGQRQRRARVAPRRGRTGDRRRGSASTARPARPARSRRPRARGHPGRIRRRDRLGRAAADGRGR